MTTPFTRFCRFALLAMVAAFSPAYATPETDYSVEKKPIQICGQQMELGYIEYSDATRWSLRHRQRLAVTFVASFNKLCSEKKIEINDRSYSDYRKYSKLVFVIDPDSSEDIRLFAGQINMSYGQVKNMADTLYVNIPYPRSPVKKTLSADTRRAILCEYNVGAKELGEDDCELR